jgi:4-hydroxy-3-methylbut-2-enyl diphosphate reductase
LWPERAALRGAARAGLRIVRVGMGPRRAAACAATLADGRTPVLVAGVCGGLAVGLAPGDVVVASEIRGAGRPVPVPLALPLAAAARRRGLRVHVGPIVSTQRTADGATRRALAATGAIAVDMESAQLAAGAAGRPFGVLRVVVDTPQRPLWRPGTVAGGVVALHTLRRAVPALADWASEVG